VEHQIFSALQPLKGLRLSIAHHAGNMRMFHFGAIRRRAKGIVGEYALHVSCPWRIETEDKILTGISDW
jgi:hypothetical protein